MVRGFFSHRTAHFHSALPVLRLRMLRTLRIAAALMLPAVSAGAVELTITNPSFETDFAPNGSFPVGAALPTGWAHYDPNGIINNNENSIGIVNPNEDFFVDGAVPDGNNAALVFLSVAGTHGIAAGLSQTLVSTLQPNTHYTLTAWVGNIGSGTGDEAYAGYGFFNLEGFPGYQIQLWAGATMLAQDDNTLAPGERMWALSTVEYTSDPSVAPNQFLQIRLINLNAAGTELAPNIEVDFDDVHLTAIAAIPEPATTGLIAGCVLALAILQRGNRKHSHGRIV
jgi:hypothetical protein